MAVLNLPKTILQCAARCLSSTAMHVAPCPDSPLLLVCVQYGLVHISVGDLLREEVKNGTPAGVRRVCQQQWLNL